MGEHILFSADIYYGQWCLWEGRGVILQGYGWCYGMAFTARTLHGYIGIALLHWAAIISLEELYTLDIEVDLRSPSRRKWLEKMGSPTRQTAAGCKLANYSSYIALKRAE
jgi:hypothetical protein